MKKTALINQEPVHANHRIQHQYPGKVKFCALCGGDMELRIVLPDRTRQKVCARCGFVHFIGPKMVAGCLIVNDGTALLIKRGIEPAARKWTFPGGFVNHGETAADAALRETFEEVGMNVELGPVFGVYTNPKDPDPQIVVFLARPGRQAPAPSDEATEVRYFAPDAIPWDRIAFISTRDALTDWVKSVSKAG